MTMEGYFEFLVYGLLNVYTANSNLNGEVLGLIIAYFCLSMVIMVAISMLWAIFTKDEK
jgi:hypothetical protein